MATNLTTGELIMRLGLAVLIGMVLGYDREIKGRAAGIRTHAIVALSSAVTTISAMMLFEELQGKGEHPDPLRVIQGLAQAIGFICAGLIFVRGGTVKNMTTAANLWMSSALGISVGLGHYLIVAIAVVMTVLLLTLVGMIERYLPGKSPDE